MLACSGQVNAKLEIVELGALLQDMQPVLRVVMRDPCDIHLEPGEQQLAVFANPTQLRQVLLNLVSNAVEAVRSSGHSKKGKVSVRVFPHTQSSEDPPPDLISGKIEQGAYVVVEVEDNGPGIVPETLPRIFEPFFSTKLAGRGLGLAAVHGILRAHNGAIAVQSEPGLGSTFRAYLHAACPERETASRPSTIPPPTDKGYTVLVVDDESVVREVMGSMLEALGFGALRASTVTEGEQLFVANADTIGLVIVDMNMPDGDGLQLRRAIHAVHPHVPVVLSSGLGDERMADLSKEEGFAAFLPKPFEMHHLESVIEKAKRREGH
jgi:CheY-like chemotaxis protein